MKKRRAKKGEGKIAWAMSDGNLVHIRDVYDDKEIECTCIECGITLTVKNSNSRAKSYFIHSEETDCLGELSFNAVVKDAVLELTKKGRAVRLPRYIDYVSSNSGLKPLIGNPISYLSGESNKPELETEEITELFAQAPNFIELNKTDIPAIGYLDTLRIKENDTDCNDRICVDCEGLGSLEIIVDGRERHPKVVDSDHAVIAIDLYYLPWDSDYGAILDAVQSTASRRWLFHPHQNDMTAVLSRQLIRDERDERMQKMLAIKSDIDDRLSKSPYGLNIKPVNINKEGRLKYLSTNYEFSFSPKITLVRDYAFYEKDKFTMIAEDDDGNVYPCIIVFSRISLLREKHKRLGLIMQYDFNDNNYTLVDAEIVHSDAFLQELEQVASTRAKEKVIEEKANIDKLQMNLTRMTNSELLHFLTDGMSIRLPELERVNPIQSGYWRVTNVVWKLLVIKYILNDAYLTKQSVSAESIANNGFLMTLVGIPPVDRTFKGREEEVEQFLSKLERLGYFYRVGYGPLRSTFKSLLK
jgi:hypothetical protein